MDRESPELIERDMQDTRQSLTDKVAALEVKVTNKIDHATTAVQDTVHTVQAAVTDTVDAVTGRVKESVSAVQDSVAGVKSALDVRDQIRQQPWPALAGAAVAGAIVGYMFGPGRPAPRSSNNFATPQAAYSPPAATASRQPGILDDLLGRLQQELRTVTEAALVTLSSSLRRSVDDGIHNLVDKTFAPKPASELSNVSRPDHNGVARQTTFPNRS